MLRGLCVVLGVSLFLAVSSAQAQEANASFDCGKATKTSEQLICKSPPLQFWDRLLDHLYTDAYQQSEAAKQVAFRDDQRAWLRQLPSRCNLPPSLDNLSSDQQDLRIQCLIKAYRKRIDVLQGDVKAVGEIAPELRPAIEIDADERADAAKSPWLTLARIQTNMEHVAAGKPLWPTGQDKLEQIVDAYAAFLVGNFDGMDKLLAVVRNEALLRRRSPAFANLSYEPSFGQKEDYFQRLSEIGNGGDALLRLLVTMRQADAVLIGEAGATQEGIGLFGDLGQRIFNQRHSDVPLPYADTWLRLPCRTIAGRVAAFGEAEKKLGKLAGPMLSCPVNNADPEEIQVLAQDSSLFFPYRAPSYLPVVVPVDTSPTAMRDRAHQGVVAHMESDPVAAGAVLQKDADMSEDYKLDYILYLHAFAKPGVKRNAKINEVLAPLIEEINAAYAQAGKDSITVKSYDGSDDSLVSLLDAGWEAGVLQSYEIPCAVLLKHPAFLETMGSEWGNSMDRFRAKSGCDFERGAIPDFPQEELDAYLSLIDEAQGYAWERFDGTMKYGWMASQYQAITEMKVAPGVAGKDTPLFDYPYQVWGLLGPSNYHVSQKIKEAYDDLVIKLTAYNLHRGLKGIDAEIAARQSLFRIADGANCGKQKPSQSLRQQLLQQAKFESAVDISEDKEAAEVRECARFAGLEPLFLVATDDPSALAMLLSSGHNVNERDAMGKTALMMAVQSNQVESIKLLLAAHAKVNLVTWKQPMDEGDSLADDARSALMYAAANGSLDVIKMLVAAGADPYQADTKGKRAIDYLLGYGPVLANSKLTAAERIEAISLFY